MILASLKLIPWDVPTEYSFEKLDGFDMVHAYAISCRDYHYKRPRAVKTRHALYRGDLWPCSFLGTLLNDPVRRLFNFIFINLGCHQKMADAVFRHDIELK